ncbi:N-acetyltransferase [Clostridium polyendosporum]|uniref:N-acetyltransferase n=1 Tax=Clostridium polyendosporum TaxID=69208 RepID=A0A919VMG7_9CLOT|nr:GNAT family N-acetyltransferase [Clostridium polyendosporum]GIM29568.1 N-acetyltransferase [Clostridium polyendosporum]
MDIKFIPFTEDYIEAAREIYNYYVRNTTVTFHIDDISYDEMKGILFHPDKRYKTFGIFHEDTLIGYILTVPFKNRGAFRRSGEVTIYLSPQLSGKGIGTKALNFIEEEARNSDIKVLLAVVADENQQSKVLFQKCGYEKCAHFKGVGEKFGRVLDLVCFEKEL